MTRPGCVGSGLDQMMPVGGNVSGDDMFGPCWALLDAEASRSWFDSPCRFREQAVACAFTRSSLFGDVEWLQTS